MFLDGAVSFRNKVDIDNSSEIQKTRNYSIFKFMKENRDINEVHLKKLIDSMREKYIPVPIIVNDSYEVIDGQHRLTACEELNLPVYYIVVKKASLKDVHRLNSNSRDWKWRDYLESFCKAGNQNYKIFRSIMNENGFAFDQTFCILAGHARSTEHRIAFERGDFVIPDYDKSMELLNKIKMISRYYDNWNRRNFVYCMLHVFKNPGYNHDEFMTKLSYQSTRLVDCLKTEEYIELIEKIYNYNRKGKKVILTK